jgi:branched-chain amino acid transport system permease protein
MVEFGSALSSGLVLTALYGIVGLGFVIIYRASGVLNFGHGAIFALGGYLGFTICEVTGMSALAAGPIVLVLGFLFGWAFYRLVMPSLAGQAHWIPVLVTAGFGFFLLAGFVQLFWTTAARDFIGNLGFENTFVMLPLQMALSKIQIGLIAGFVVSEIGLLLFYRYTSVGIQMRAASQDHHLASFRGINLHVLFALAWGIASALAMTGGFAYSVDQRLGLHIGVIAIKAFPAAMVGGLESIGGLAVGAFLIGMIEAFATVYIDPLLSELVPFAFLLLILFTRPWGLFGRPQGVLRV